MITQKQNLGVSLAIVAVAIIGSIWLINRPIDNPNPNTPPPGVETEALMIGFLCEEEKKFFVTFEVENEDEVVFDFEGKTPFILPRTPSASGSRYANEDGSFVFWTQGNEAFVEEGGEMTYKDCVVDTVTPDWMF